MMKSINPSTRAYTKRTIDPLWRKLYERLDVLCRMQLVLCPDSIAHTDESVLGPHFEDTKRLYEQLSHGVTFEHFHTIKRRQVYAHALDLIDGLDHLPSPFDPNSVIPGNINAWQDFFFFSFPQKWVIDSKDAKRQFRNSLHCSLTSIFESWRRETDRCFEDWAEEESKGFGKGVLECFFEHLKKHGGQRDQLEPDPVDYSSSPLAVDFVLDVYGACFTKGLNRTEALTFVLSYFRSTDLNTIPFNRISSMLWAALARKAASGQVHPPSRGMHQDIETISVLLPYCHAMFLDKQCHAFLNDEPLRSELKYGTRIFSLRNEEEFSDYLDQIEQSVPEEHLAALEEVYGERKPKPNTSLFSNGKTL